VVDAEDLPLQLIVWGNDYSSLGVPQFKSGDRHGGGKSEEVYLLPLQDELQGPFLGSSYLLFEVHPLLCGFRCQSDE
jgi:hypothetical protein